MIIPEKAPGGTKNMQVFDPDSSSLHVGPQKIMVLFKLLHSEINAANRCVVE